jgi:uncharacterized protein with PIN domain
MYQPQLGRPQRTSRQPRLSSTRIFVQEGMSRPAQRGTRRCGSRASPHRTREEAVGAYLRFDKGRHKAQLNFGDCLTYAVARLADEPLLFTDGDFTETDLKLA